MDFSLLFTSPVSAPHTSSASKGDISDRSLEFEMLYYTLKLALLYVLTRDLLFRILPFFYDGLKGFVKSHFPDSVAATGQTVSDFCEDIDDDIAAAIPGIGKAVGSIATPLLQQLTPDVVAGALSELAS